MYLDSAYIAKYYVNESDSAAVRRQIQRAAHVCSSILALVEVTCVFHRHVRERALTAAQGQALTDLFRTHVEFGVWNLVAMTEQLLLRTASLVRNLPRRVPLRAGDAIHLATAVELHEPEIWTKDRHLLAAARHCGLTGKSV